MAGYIFSLGKDNAQEILKNCIYNGCYSTNMSPITETTRNFIPFLYHLKLYSLIIVA